VSSQKAFSYPSILSHTDHSGASRKILTKPQAPRKCRIRIESMARRYRGAGHVKVSVSASVTK